MISICKLTTLPFDCEFKGISRIFLPDAALVDCFDFSIIS